MSSLRRVRSKQSRLVLAGSSSCRAYEPSWKLVESLFRKAALRPKSCRSPSALPSRKAVVCLSALVPIERLAVVVVMPPKRPMPGPQHRPLTQSVAQALRRLSLSRDPGVFLGSERDLMAEFGVSRPTFRQAVNLIGVARHPLFGMRAQCFDLIGACQKLNLDFGFKQQRGLWRNRLSLVQELLGRRTARGPCFAIDWASSSAAA